MPKPDQPQLTGATRSDSSPSGDVALSHPAQWPVLDVFGAIGAMHEKSEMAVFVIGLDNTVAHINEVGQILLHLTASGTRTGERAPVTVLKMLLDHLPKRLLTDPEGGHWSGDVDINQDNGDVITLEMNIVVRHDVQSPTGGFIAGIGRDVTDERERHADLFRQVELDPTTELLNHDAFIGKTTQTLASVQNSLMFAAPGIQTESGPAILVVDIDALADISDALGHDVGTHVLVACANRLVRAVRPNDVVARLGAGRFAMLCADVADAAIALDLANRIRRSLAGRITIAAIELDLSVSVGIAVSEVAHLTGDHRSSALELLGQADAAERWARQGGRGRTAVYNDAMRVKARIRTEFAASLTSALRNHEFAVDYQPIYSAVSERAVAAEALLRWNHPTSGRLNAYEFLSIAEETGVITAIGDWALRQACSDARHWIDSGVVDRNFSVHVNVSKIQLTNSAFVPYVVQVLREYDLRPGQLVLEAREATLLSDTPLGGYERDDDVTRSVRALRRVGVRLAIDNFGTGTNALSLLTDVGADVLKLDGELALPSGASEADNRVVRALVLLAHALDMEVVAERVTALEQLRRLRAAGCDYVQGHLLGLPVGPAEFHSHTSP